MFLGLILIVVGSFGRRRVVINNIVSVNAPPAAMPKEARRLFTRSVQGRREPVLDAPDSDEALPPPIRDYREPQLRTVNPEPYDRTKWKALVEYDPDISRA